MRNLIRMGLFAALALGGAALASDIWIGRLYKASGAVNNTTTTDDGGTFTLSPTLGVNFHVAVQCNTDSCVATGKDAGLSVQCANQGLNQATGTNAEAIAGGLLFDVPVAPSHFILGAVAADGGLVSCDVYRVAQMSGN